MQLNRTFIDKIKKSVNQQNGTLYQLTWTYESELDCLQVASQTDINEIIYFSKPKQTIEYLAFGAWRVANNKMVRKILNTNKSDTRWFGINAFSSESKKRTEYWVLPKVWFEKSKNSVEINIVIDLEKDTQDSCLDQIVNILKKIDTSTHSLQDQSYINQSHIPNKSTWMNIVKEAQQKIKNAELHKVVLARQSIFDFKEKVNPFLLLKKVQDKDNGVYNFCIKTNSNYSFIGGTPERLFEIKSGKITSDAIAGTLFKPEGADVARLKNELLTSQKNIGEHQHVVDFIAKKLTIICTQVDADQNRSLIELKFLLHLIMHFEGKLKNGCDWLDAMSALHPTPAVGGVPSDTALNFINQHESFDRGWYAGPMGTITQSEAHIVVAIRSGDVIDNQVILAAGAGIVADSDADAEWDELNAKINLFTSIFRDSA